MDPLLAHKDETLVAHLESVGEKARLFAAAFDAAEQAQMAGVLHDLGKAEDEFQKRIHLGDGIKDSNKKQPHAHHGAAYALHDCHPSLWPVAIAVNGHHAGLHNRGNVDQRADEYDEKAKACLEKIRDGHPDFTIPVLRDMLPEWLKRLEFLPGNKGNGWLSTDLFTRFLFSALVDADRLDTEENAEDAEKKREARRWEPFVPESLLQRLEEELSMRAQRAVAEGRASNEVIAVRQNVGDYCRKASTMDRGLFSLTVPTGGGKTLASMLFALSHAVHHSRAVPEDRCFRRIIVVIPYLSIIQQTAKELRDVFESDEPKKNRLVLEHHSQVENEPVSTGGKQDKEEPSYDSVSERRRLAAENWDAPIIVTTSVQFFDSLFSRRPAKARKLHNIAQSIIIFDEIQTLPPLMLQPILHALSELANPQRHYGCSIVLCTATQPALGKSENLPYGLENVRPIVPQENAKGHFNLLRRVTYRGLDRNEQEEVTWEELAGAVLQQEVQQALIVVNTRQAARDLHGVFRDKLGNNGGGLFHLSTWMMPAHRLEVLDEVKRRLDPKNLKDKERERCILVSTQCIEAGVDVDFPTVWRAFGPYDSIVQAAGRCNRNGLVKNREDAVVHIFRPKDGEPPPGLYRTAIAQTELLRKMGLAAPENPDSFTDYFRLLYQLSVPDECGIQRARSRFHFKEVDELFHFIEQDTISVLVRNQYIGENLTMTSAGELYDQARRRRFSDGKNTGYFTREEWRVIQPNIINLPISCLKDEKLKGKLDKAFNDESSGLYVWNGAYRGGFHGTGIDFEGPMPVEELIL